MEWKDFKVTYLLVFGSHDELENLASTIPIKVSQQIDGGGQDFTDSKKLNRDLFL